ncbi:hypothetical protein K458DRAFT_322106 [Lentithecium fluviatile CBS 122367]|uniref:Uncharacterized protein n=1 Tax=Lentithecium fluviatile CBS 122367 TaxID=1168545 RepID=A0A6G1IDU5_9PLEO|nr:hypothetical protein K458DRAFT_322106 [Lentithecium fluviatile CBS 122367]
MCDTTFTFGQRGNHFFQSPSRRDYTRLPKKLAALLTSVQLQKVHHVSLGFGDSFMLTWRDKEGYDHIEFHALPIELTNFLYAKSPTGHLLRSISKVRVTLGPYNHSFFATDGSACLWMNLPPLLLSALQTRIKNGNWTDRPRLVSLGSDQNFLLITEGNAAVWELPQYATLSQMLEYSRSQDSGIEEVYNVTLHPHRYQCFVAQARNGTLLYGNLPPHEVPAIQALQPVILQDTRAAEKSGKERERERRLIVERRPSLRHQGSLKTDWGEGDTRQEIRARKQANGLRLSLSLSVSAKGIAGGFGLGRMLG